MPEFRLKSRFPVPVAELFAWHERPGAFRRLSPPWERVRVLRADGGIRDGGTAVILVRRGPLAFRLKAEHFDYLENRRFSDRLVEGPFPEWTHVHSFEPDPEEGESAAWLEDEVRYRLPGGALGQSLAGRHFERMLPRLFAFRHERLRRDLERHAPFRDAPRLRVAVSGAGGLIGGAFCDFLQTGGHQVQCLVRREPLSPAEIRWDPDTGEVDAARLDGVDAVVHLAGASIAAEKWSKRRKALLRSSRVEATEGLCRALAQLSRPPGVLLAASATGYYGDRGVEVLDEDAAPGKGFLAEIAADWEKATEPARGAGIRVARLRTGIVLAAAGGALGRLLPLVRLGLAGPLGSGRQYWSWIAMEDVVGSMHFLLQHPGAKGPFNLTAPEPLTNAEFTRTLGRVLRRPAFLPAPAEAIRTVMGEMADEMLLSGQRAVPRRLVELGYRFQCPTLEQAVRWEVNGTA